MKPCRQSHYQEVYKKEKKVQNNIPTSREAIGKINNVHGIKTLGKIM